MRSQRTHHALRATRLARPPLAPAEPVQKPSAPVNVMDEMPELPYRSPTLIAEGEAAHADALSAITDIDDCEWAVTGSMSLCRILSDTFGAVTSGPPRSVRSSNRSPTNASSAPNTGHTAPSATLSANPPTDTPTPTRDLPPRRQNTPGRNRSCRHPADFVVVARGSDPIALTATTSPRPSPSRQGVLRRVLVP